MAKLTKEELIAKVNDKLADNSELAIELMEDITDSFEEVDLSGYVEKVIYDELLQKYKDRFLNPEEVKEEIKEEETIEEPEEKVIDIQEIFEEEEDEE
jgi:hypothetical protein